MVERPSEQAYSWEEVFTFERLKRNMVTRVLDRLEKLSEGNKPVSPDQVTEIVQEEWDKAKMAVRSSPAAREAFRKYLEKTVSEQIDKLIERDRNELQALGVVEKGL